jgi:CHAD domain-containing protein
VKSTPADVVQHRAAAFLAHGMHAIGGARDDELHAMRIAGKRLRYNLEFFASRLGPSHTTALRLMALIQDRLGAVADADALLRALAGLAAPLAASDPRRKGIERCIAEARAERARSINAIHALWHGRGHSPYPEMLAASVAVALAPSSSTSA